MQHACTSAEDPRTTSGAVQANRTNGASATPLGPVWVYARYPTTMHMPSVDAACVYECGGPTHDERRCASKSHEWRLSDAARARAFVLGVAKSSLGGATSSLGDAKSSLGDAKSSLRVTLRARWVSLRAPLPHLLHFTSAQTETRLSRY
jgi:hypothetical protein